MPSFALILLLAVAGLALLAFGTGLAAMAGDALLKVTKALSADDSAVTSDAIDTRRSTDLGANVVNADYELAAPALAVGQLANGSTMTYAIITSDNADLSEPTTYIPSALVQTGAGGAGAAAATFRFRLPSNAKRYVGFTATNSAAADASGASATLRVVF